MAYNEIKEYWKDKEKRAEKAQRHAESMKKYFSKYIQESIDNTVYYFPNFECKKELPEVNTEIILDDIDTVSAIFKYDTKEQKIAALNFASYKNPGGMFLNGSKAQEECLCHESFLYNVLSECKDYYEWNNQHKNKALYLNRALYTPKIFFVKREDVFDLEKEAFKWCDVINCACPNKSAAKKYMNVTNEENTEVLRSRIKFVLDIAKCEEVETLILGAYGCGVFGQDPMEVANIFKEYLDTTHKCFKRVVFAVPKGKNFNYEAFEKVFEGK